MEDWYEMGAIITGMIVFLGVWGYCAATYGFLFGFGLGWLPAGICAVIAAMLWPLLALLILLGVGLLARAMLK